MATRTRTGRPATAGRGGFARSSSTLRRRRQAEPSGLKKLAGAVLPAAAARKAAPGSRKGKAGGFALAAAAAGMAFKNRGRLAGLRRSRSGSDAR
jgi:hypothetical protein